MILFHILSGLIADSRSVVSTQNNLFDGMGPQWEGSTFILTNRWELSVIRTPGSYGNKNGEGLIEVAAIDPNGDIPNTVAGGRNPEGWLDTEGVLAFRDKVAAL
jgi:hypothetical protein